MDSDFYPVNPVHPVIQAFHFEHFALSRGYSMGVARPFKPRPAIY